MDVHASNNSSVDLSSNIVLVEVPLSWKLSLLMAVTRDNNTIKVIVSKRIKSRVSNFGQSERKHNKAAAVIAEMGIKCLGSLLN